METYFEPWRKFATFSGRASRKEYWTFVLVNAVIYFSLNLFAGLASRAGSVSESDPAQLLASLFYLVTIIPGLAVTVRRLHDINVSGWLALLGLVPCVGLILIVFTLRAGDIGENLYGPDPYEDEGLSSDPGPPPPGEYADLSGLQRPSDLGSSGFLSVVPRDEYRPQARVSKSESKANPKYSPNASTISMIQSDGPGSKRSNDIFNAEGLSTQYLAKPRQQHYYFAHVYLRDKALAYGPAAVEDYVKPKAADHLKIEWLTIGMASKDPSDDFIPPDGIEVYSCELGGAYKAAIIKLPEPKGPSEAFMTAIVVPIDTESRNATRARYFTLELSPRRPTRSSMCEWTDFGHINLAVENPPPNIEAFKNAIYNLML